MVKYTNEKLKKDLSRFIRKVQQNYILKEALLFGSRARGDNFLDSDVDILLVSDNFKGKLMTERMSDILTYWTAPIDLEPLCYTAEEFNRKKKQFGIVQQAVKEGVSVNS
ncbi:nucleotidyltransferase domain-containing protein [Candidatus Woesearchaeota archaeon]|nr:nucleotidyltransferase domain-containing protein [Candidatus Woesearchaeota archaeon]